MKKSRSESGFFHEEAALHVIARSLVPLAVSHFTVSKTARACAWQKGGS
jgi:hypothetical protein